MSMSVTGIIWATSMKPQQHVSGISADKPGLLCTTTCMQHTSIQNNRSTAQSPVTLQRTCVVIWARAKTAFICPAVRRLRPWLPVPPTLSSLLHSSHTARCICMMVYSTTFVQLLYGFRHLAKLCTWCSLHWYPNSEKRQPQTL